MSFTWQTWYNETALPPQNETAVSAPSPGKRSVILDSGWPPHAVADSSRTQMGSMRSKAWHRPKAIENPGNARATQNDLSCYNQAVY